MTDNDDPFGRRDRTIIRPNPGGRRPTPSSPPDRARRLSCAARRRRAAGLDANAAGPLSGAPTRRRPTPRRLTRPRLIRRPPRRKRPAQGGQANWDGWMTSPTPPPVLPYLQQNAAAAPMTPAPIVAARVGRSGHRRRQPADARRRVAAAAARAAARLAVARRRRPTDGSGRAGDPAIRNRCARRRRPGRPGQRRQIRARRLRRRHRSEPAQRRSPDLDAVQHARALLRRAHRRREILSGARSRQAEPERQSRPARSHARMPEPRFRRRLSRFGRRGRATRPAARSLRHDPPRPTQDDRGPLAALARPEHRAGGQPVSGARLGRRHGRRSDPAGRLSLSAQHAERAGRGACDQDGASASRHGNRHRARDRGQTAARSAGEDIDAARAHPRGARRRNSRRQAQRRSVDDNDLRSHRHPRAVPLRRRQRSTTAFAPIARKIAASLDKEPGAIRIDGYTDSDPIRTIAFPSNFELSEARAKSVAGLLKSDLAKPERVVVAGKGAENPVAPNDTEANKSKNRRVEISIPRAD